jgi:hypothetical protein
MYDVLIPNAPVDKSILVDNQVLVLGEASGADELKIPAINRSISETSDVAVKLLKKDPSKFTPQGEDDGVPMLIDLLTAILPTGVTDIRVEEPLSIENGVAPTLTDAVTEPVATLDKLSPVIPEAGMLNKLAPEPDKIP